jgi:hypothetical protein
VGQQNGTQLNKEQVELLYLGRNACPLGQTLENLECLAEKVGTLSLQTTRKNCCGAAKKQARRARFAEATTGDSGSSQPRSAPMDRLQTQQKPGKSGYLHGEGPALAKLTSPEGGGHLQGPSK